ncbi:ABC transporter permease [Verticiella sediminum]|uniref:ABC transporter permease n=1 Tax=Verticiella sediminum TaxID=1247510 RepID=A0A556AQ17_9BURK|nr:ABC transporter permease [Verticiella sediminum]TSH94976.1 ABC transporter permease [Verticiella sediminum]
MLKFLTKRLCQSALLLILVSIIGFSILHLAPGGPLGVMGGGNLSAEDISALERQLGLDQPLPLQYASWVGHIAVGDWGRSYRDNAPVLEAIGSRLGATFELMIAAISLAMLIGIVVGIVSALKKDSWFDVSATSLSMVLISLPSFWLGFIVIYFFSIELGWLPAGNRNSPGVDTLVDRLWHLAAPACVLAIIMMATWSRYMRASIIEVLSQDFVRTALAKGIPRYRILFAHIIRNALLPMIALFGLQFPSLLGGALVTETVFTWPGMGRLFLDSISYRDYPVVMGILLLSSVMVLLGNLIADILYAIADPRIRLD